MPDAVVEQIPDADHVSRLVDHPHKISDHGELLWQNIFLFSEGVESLVWRKYCPEIADVHALGCAQQARKRESGRATTYKGAITSVAERIRTLRSAKGHGFKVEHRPEDDQGQHHAEVELAYANGAQATKAERSELKRMIHSVWNPLEAHACPTVSAQGGGAAPQ